MTISLHCDLEAWEPVAVSQPRFVTSLGLT